MAARDEGRHRDRAAHAAVEAGTGPDLAPRVARDQVLEVLGERGRRRDRAVDVVVAENGAPELHALVVTVVAHVRKPSTAASNASGCATLAMCAAPSIST